MIKYIAIQDTILQHIENRCEQTDQKDHRGATWETYFKRKERYYKKKEHLEKIKNIFTPSDKGLIKHLSTIFNYLQCFFCKFDYLENAVTITTKLPYFVIFISRA